MKDEFVVNRKDMLELLKKAFEAGWHGYLDLKDSVCQEIYEQYVNDMQTMMNKELSPSQEAVAEQHLEMPQSLWQSSLSSFNKQTNKIEMDRISSWLSFSNEISSFSNEVLIQDNNGRTYTINRDAANIVFTD